MSSFFGSVTRALSAAVARASNQAPNTAPAKALADSLARALLARTAAQAAQKQAQQAHDQQKGLEQKLSDARKALQANAPELARSPGVVDADPAIVSLKQQVAQAKSAADMLQLDAVAKSNVALAAERAANAAAADSHRPAPFPNANQVQDSFEAASKLSLADQQRLLGGPAAVTDAQSDALKVPQALKQGPQQATAMLESLLRPGDAEHDRQLLQAVAPQLTQVGQSLVGKPPLDEKSRDAVAASLTRMTEGLPPDQQAAVAKAVADGIPEDAHGLHVDHDGVGIAFKRAIASTGDTAFAVSFANALSASGKSNDASDALRVTNEAVTDARADFEKTATVYQRKMDELQRYQTDMGPLLGQDALAKATARFMADNKSLVDDFNAKGAKLAGMIPGLQAFDPEHASQGQAKALAETYGAVLKDVPSLMQSDQGRQVLSGLMLPEGEAAKSEQVPFLERAQKTLESINAGKEPVEQLTDAYTKLAGQRITALANAGNFDGAQAVIEDLGNHASALGLSGKDLNEFKLRLGTYARATADVLRGAPNPAELDAKMKALKSASSDLEAFGPGSRLGDVVTSYNVVASGVAVLNGLRTWSDADVQSRLGTTAAAVGGLSDASKLISKMMDGSGLLEKGSQALDLLSKGLGPVAIGLDTLVSGISTFQDFKSGDITHGLVDGLTTAGGVVSLIPGGQGVGALMMGGGMLLNFGMTLLGGSDPGGPSKAQLQHFLEAGGVDPKVAASLAGAGVGTSSVGSNNLGGFVHQLGQQLGIPDAQILPALAKLTPEQRDLIFGQAASFRRFPSDPNDPSSPTKFSDATVDPAATTRLQSDAGRAEIRITGPQSMEEMLFWLKDQGFVDSSGALVAGR